MRVVRLGFAILNLSVAAKYFGVSLDRDIWLLAMNAIIILDVAIWAPLNDTFRAKFLFTKEEKGIQVALEQTKSLLLLVNLVTLLVVILIMLFPELLAKILAPSFEAKKLAPLIFMIRLLAPTFLLNQVTKIFTSILNTYQSFIVPEVAGLISQMCTLVVIIIFAPKMGILSLAIAYYLGFGLLLVLLILQMIKHKINLFDRLFEAQLKAALPFFAFSLPFFIPHFVSQVNLVVEKSLASSSAEGMVSVLDYARKFIDIPLDVLIGILTTMLVPVLSAHFTQKIKAGFLTDFLKIYQFGLLIIAIVIGVFTGCAGAIVDFLYHKGNVETTHLQQISKLTMFYSWSAFGVFLYHIYGLSLLTVKKGKLFALYGTVAQLLMIGLNLYLFKDYGVYVFPLSLGASHFIAAAIMAFHFPLKNRLLLMVSIKYSTLIFMLALLMYFFNKYMVFPEAAIFTIILNIVIISLILVTAIFIAKFEERKIIQKYFKKLFA